MGSAPAQYAAIVGMDSYAVDNLFDERFARPRGLSGNTLNFVSQYLTEKHRTRTLVQVFDNNRITITDHDRLLDAAGPSQALPEGKRAVLIQASGHKLEQLGPTIVHAAGIEPEQVIPFESLGYTGTLPTADVVGFVPEERVGLLIAMARWRSMLVKPPVFVAHATSDVDAAVAEALFRAAVPTFVRDYTMCFVVTSWAREALNGLLNITEDSDGLEVVPYIPRQAAAVLSGVDSFSSGDITVLGKTPLVAKGRPDARRLARALFEAMDRVPDVAAMTPHAPVAPRRTDDAEQVGDPRELERLAGELEEARGRVQTANETITALRRELRAAHHALDAAQPAEHHPPAAGPAVDAPSVDPVEVPTPPALEPDLLGQTPATFAEVFELARAHLPLVTLPERVDAQVDELTGSAKTAVWAARTWAILATLQAYAQARAQGVGVANVRTYMNGLAHPPFAPNQVAQQESNAVSSNARMRAERTFPVPVAVNADGWQYMGAHVRVDSSGKMPAPRMYFHDDSAGATGQVHVGYIGPHLTNMRTT